MLITAKWALRTRTTTRPQLRRWYELGSSYDGHKEQMLSQIDGEHAIIMDKIVGLTTTRQPICPRSHWMTSQHRPDDNNGMTSLPHLSRDRRC